MRVLMLSLDRGLLGASASGDVVARHQKYADLAGSLDVIVFAGSEFENMGLSTNLRIFPTRSKKLSHYASATAIAKRLMQSNHFDLLVTQDFAAPAGREIKKFLSVPWIVNVHSMFFSLAWLRVNPLNWYLFYKLKKAIVGADGFRVNNGNIRDQLRSWRITAPILIQPTPVDFKKFQIPNNKFQTKSKNRNLKVLYVGRLSPEKNVRMLIRAFQSVLVSPSDGVERMKQSQNQEIATRPEGVPNGIELEIVGAGPEEPKLRALAGGDQRIQFLGTKSPDELVSIYQRADIFVLPSHTESFGQVLLQAAAAGCAIISTRTPGAVSIFGQSKAAVLIDINDQVALAFALKNLLQDKEARRGLGVKAQGVAEQYDSEKGISSTIEFWKEIASSASGGLAMTKSS